MDKSNSLKGENNIMNKSDTCEAVLNEPDRHECTTPGAVVSTLTFIKLGQGLDGRKLRSQVQISSYP